MRQKIKTAPEAARGQTTRAKQNNTPELYRIKRRRIKWEYMKDH